MTLHEYSFFLPVSNATISPAIYNILITFNTQGITSLTFNTKPKNNTKTPKFISQIKAYLNGKQVDLTTIPTSIPTTKTTFQKTVWKAAKNIPYGKAITYAQLAKKIATPAHARAVGNALGANPIPLIIPCHRIIAAGRGLGGFSSGLHVKKALLTLEGITYDTRY